MLKEKRRELWKKDPLIWAEDVLGVNPHSIAWASWPGYPEDIVLDSGYYTHKRIPEPNGEVRLVSEFHPVKSILHYVMLCLAGTLRPEYKYIATEAGNASGKTFVAAIMVLWFLAVHEDTALVITFATKKEQLKKGLWREIERHMPRFKEHYPEADFLAGEPELRMGGRTRMATGYGAMKKAGAEVAVDTSGFHDENMLFIFEEVPGIYPPIIESIKRTCARPNNRIWFIGNPTGEEDLLHQQCLSPSTLHIRISGLDHVNVVMQDHALVPGAITQEWIDERLSDVFGEETHPNYQTPVRGICPKGSGRAIISQDLIELVEGHVIKPSSAEYYNRISDSDYMETFAIYHPPEQTHLFRYIAAIDPAGDMTDGDYHAFVVYDRVRDTIAAMVHAKGDAKSFLDKCLLVCRSYSIPISGGTHDPMLVWERNFSSVSLYMPIRKYRHVYRPRPLDSKGKAKKTKAVGWHTGGHARQVMQNSLMEWLSTLYRNPEKMTCERLFYELKTFVKKKTLQNGKPRYEHANGCKDDVVLAFMMARAVNEEMNDRPPYPLANIQNTTIDTPKIGREKPALAWTEKQRPWGSQIKPWGSSGKSAW